MFGTAKWIGADEDVGGAILIAKDFDYTDGTATLRLIGLATFEAYINGKRVENDWFLPMNSEYEKTQYPVDEELYGFHVYTTEYDVTRYLVKGKNTLVLHLGGGWYTGVNVWIRKIYGKKKAIFSLDINGEAVISDGSERWTKSYVTESSIYLGESHDFTGWDDSLLCGEGEGWRKVELARPLDSEYAFTDCPPDRVMSEVTPAVAAKGDGYVIYDAFKNTSGLPVVKTRKGYVGEVKITFAEALVGDDLDPEHIHGQHLNILCDGKEHTVSPKFTWLGFRYFKVEGECDVESVYTIHADIKVISSFESSNEVLNWIHDTYLHTQLTNMHRGIPSDCPHIERLGYTGDGQLLCKSAMMTLNTKEFYAKWMTDIADTQDKLSGRVQYCAPYFHCGGGPGGWSSAIVNVPYEYYKAYGDDSFIKKLYPQMLHYLDFLDTHSEYDLVTSYKKDTWCLGDWVTPVDWTLPTPFVNTCLCVDAMHKIVEIARLIGKEEDIPALEERIAVRKKAIKTVYFNDFFADDTFCANTQGAGAFALNIGLGTDNTKRKFIKYYESNPVYDTGIFGTELITRKLFEYGRGDVSLKLLTHNDAHGFARWRAEGYTTFREYWGNDYCRSYNHPMFGAVVACFYEFILGIQQEKDSAGYQRVIISPAVIQGLNSAGGHITTVRGVIAVEYTTEGNVRKYTVTVPAGISARIAINGVDETTVSGGTFEFTATI